MKKRKFIKNLIEKLPLYTSIILIIISIVWFMIETNERQDNYYETATVVSMLTGKDNVRINYHYGFAEIDAFINVPKFVNIRVGDEIPVCFNKQDLDDVTYGQDTRLGSLITCCIGVLLLGYYILEEQAKENKQKLKDMQSARMYRAINSNNYNNPNNNI